MTTLIASDCTSNASAPVMRGIRAYFAPIDRSCGAPVVFDACQGGSFDPDAPPAPWVDLGWVDNFIRKSESKTGVLASGTPAKTSIQLREQLDATVSLCFLHWGKLQMALTGGSEHWNLLSIASSQPNGVSLVAGSTATSLMMSGSDSSLFRVGQIVAVDIDYTGQTGYLGSGASGTCVNNAAVVQGDANFIRRVTLNVARVAAVRADGIYLAEPLLFGAPSTAMRVQPVVGFMDREGGTFFQEWSALFVVQGEEGERIFYNYPRLQAMTGGRETIHPLVQGLDRTCLAGNFRAMPVIDSHDGQSILCYRNFLPALGMPL
jgi:hypothetical protein